MITNNLIYVSSLTILSILLWLLKAPKNARLYLTIPISLTIYFIVSTLLFDFGQEILVLSYDKEKHDLYLFILTCINLMFISALFGTALSNLCIPPPRPLKEIQKIKHIYPKHETKLKIQKSFPRDLTLAGISSLPALLILTSTSIETLLRRDQYVIEEINALNINIADTLFWISIIAIPFIKNKALRYGSLASLVSAYIMLGARQAPIAIIIFVAIDMILVKKKLTALHFLFSALAALVLIVIIGMRDIGAGGLIRFIEIITSIGELKSISPWGPINYLTNSSIITNALAYEEIPTNQRAFLYAISPLPSFIHDDAAYYIQQTSILSYVPYPGLSYLFKHTGVLIASFSLFTLFFALELIRNILIRKRDDFDSIFYGTSILAPSIFMLQYSLRAPARMLIVFFSLYIVFSYIRSNEIAKKLKII